MNLRQLTQMALLLACSTASHAAADVPHAQRVQQAIEDFVGAQGNGLPGAVSVVVGGFDSRLNLAACPAPQAFLPPGARLWGKVTVGVRCTGAQPWTFYVPVTVRVMAQVVVAAQNVAQGRPIELADLTLREADLGQMPAAVLTDPQLAVGRIAASGIVAGQALRHDLLRAPLVIQQGQSVTLRAQGSGFRVSVEGKALTNAAEGQVTQVRLPSGQSISGIARPGGVVEVY